MKSACVILTPKEADFLIDVLQNWREGVQDAKEATMNDNRTLETFEHLLEASAGLDEQTKMVDNMLFQLPHRE